MSKRQSFNWAAAIGLLVAGAVAGPIVFALVHAAGVALFDPHARVSPETADTYKRAEHLFKAYQPYRPDTQVGTLIDIDAPPWHACGYPELDAQLYPSAQPRPPRARPGDDFGEQSRLLQTALYTAANDEQDSRALEKLTRSTSDFTATFLADCIESTALRRLCVSRIQALLDGDVRFRPTVDLPHAYHTRCTFYDGIAARSGLPLADRP